MSIRIIACIYHRRFSKHHGWVIECVTFFQKQGNFFIRGRNGSLSGRHWSVAFKFKHLSAHYINIRFKIEFLQLLFKTLRNRNIIRIHPGDKLIGGSTYTEIQGFSQATVLGQRKIFDSDTAFTKQFVYLGLKGIRNFTVADKHYFLGQHGLIQNTVHGSSEILRLLVFIYAH